MNFVALRMLTGDRAKYLGLIFAIAFCTFLLENQTSIFASILKRTGSQILDVTDANVWVMDGKTEYFEQTKALKDTDLTRVRGVNGVEWAVKLFKGYPVARTRAGKFAACILLGLDDATLTGAPREMLLGSWERLREPDSIVIDNAGYILLFPGEPLELDRELEMAGRQAAQLHDLTLGAGNFFSVGPGISLPLFTGGRIRSNIAVQTSRQREAVIGYQSTVLNALEEVENALISYSQEQERRDRLNDAVAHSQLAVDLAAEQYKAGLVDFLSVLDAQRDLYANEDQLVQSQTSVTTNLVGLYRALGGGWNLGRTVATSKPTQ